MSKIILYNPSTKDVKTSESEKNIAAYKAAGYLAIATLIGFNTKVIPLNESKETLINKIIKESKEV